MARAAFLHSAELERFSYPEGSPFKTDRAGLTLRKIQSMGLIGAGDRTVVAPEKASRAELERFHAPRYLDALQKGSQGELDVEGFAMGLGTADCPVFRGMFEYFQWAAGASLTGARMIISGAADIVFNPSGGLHHAGPDYAAGFCYVNDIVLAAMEFAAAGRRVFFLDIDVHHCDGVQNAFYGRSDVMTASMHESGKTLFPGTGFETEIGTGAGTGYTLNVPLPVGTYDAAYLGAFHEAVLPVMKAFKPDVVILEIGMDALAGDPLAHLNLTNNVHADIIGDVMALGRPVLATGGGGYHVENTVRGWALAWSVLCGDALHDMSMGMGGVMLGNMDWSGGLRDRMLISDAGHRGAVDTEVKRVVDKIRETVFPCHGLPG